MGRLDINADVDVDSGVEQGSIFTDVIAKLNFGINSIAAQLKKANDLEQQRLENFPNYVTLVQTTPTLADGLVDFGEPQPGRKWNIRLLTAFCNPPTQADAAVTVTWYVGQRGLQGTLPGRLTPDMAVWQQFGVSAFKDFSSDLITVLPRQHLMAGITGLTTNQVYASVRVNDLPFYNPLTSVNV